MFDQVLEPRLTAHNNIDNVPLILMLLIITLLLLCLLAEVNAGDAPLGDVREPNLGASHVIEQILFMLLIFLQKGKCTNCTVL
jgi:hypothetical protein